MASSVASSSRGQMVAADSGAIDRSYYHGGDSQQVLMSGPVSRVTPVAHRAYRTGTGSEVTFARSGYGLYSSFPSAIVRNSWDRSVPGASYGAYAGAYGFPSTGFGSFGAPVSYGAGYLTGNPAVGSYRMPAGGYGLALGHPTYLPAKAS
eukprot:NODE_4862_length_751_cov_5.769231_g4509_i0.p1 GENE.NODE_4862_length_751_cov_5.769231_g4509_i0~~NODE_4862_length_751_cov_5.769231_g4509_i0.p1  ORF type:complete len:150 (-),score=5.00 NODE_4862_length_751_cov_5.769231_g4509_i0:191-640(-)